MHGFSRWPSFISLSSFVFMYLYTLCSASPARYRSWSGLRLQPVRSQCKPKSACPGPRQIAASWAVARYATGGIHSHFPHCHPCSTELLIFTPLHQGHPRFPVCMSASRLASKRMPSRLRHQWFWSSCSRCSAPTLLLPRTTGSTAAGARGRHRLLGAGRRPKGGPARRLPRAHAGPNGHQPPTRRERPLEHHARVTHQQGCLLRGAQPLRAVLVA